MKKILTSVLFLLLCSTMLMAQSAGTLIFVDNNGNEISDGATLNRQDVAEDDFGEILMPSGLCIKNTSNDIAGVRMICTIKTLDNGNFQICFPTNCISKGAVETFNTPAGMISGNQTIDLQSEWIPKTYGKCSVSYQVQAMTPLSGFPPKYEEGELGPTVTINYEYADPASVNDIDDKGNTTVTARYSIGGTPLSAPQHGINIVKMRDGKTIKQINK